MYVRDTVDVETGHSSMAKLLYPAKKQNKIHTPSLLSNKLSERPMNESAVTDSSEYP